MDNKGGNSYKTLTQFVDLDNDSNKKVLVSVSIGHINRCEGCDASGKLGKHKPTCTWNILNQHCPMHKTKKIPCRIHGPRICPPEEDPDFIDESDSLATPVNLSPEDSPEHVVIPCNNSGDGDTQKLSNLQDATGPPIKEEKQSGNDPNIMVTQLQPPPLEREQLKETKSENNKNVVSVANCHEKLPKSKKKHKIKHLKNTEEKSDMADSLTSNLSEVTKSTTISCSYTYIDTLSASLSARIPTIIQEALSSLPIGNSGMSNNCSEEVNVNNIFEDKPVTRDGIINPENVSFEPYQMISSMTADKIKELKENLATPCYHTPQKSIEIYKIKGNTVSLITGIKDYDTDDLPHKAVSFENPFDVQSTEATITSTQVTEEMTYDSKSDFDDSEEIQDLEEDEEPISCKCVYEMDNKSNFPPFNSELMEKLIYNHQKSQQQMPTSMKYSYVDEKPLDKNKVIRFINESKCKPPSDESRKDHTISFSKVMSPVKQNNQPHKINFNHSVQTNDEQHITAGQDNINVIHNNLISLRNQQIHHIASLPWIEESTKSIHSLKKKNSKKVSRRNFAHKKGHFVGFSQMKQQMTDNKGINALKQPQKIETPLKKIIHNIASRSDSSVVSMVAPLNSQPHLSDSILHQAQNYFNHSSIESKSESNMCKNTLESFHVYKSKKPSIEYGSKLVLSPKLENELNEIIINESKEDMSQSHEINNVVRIRGLSTSYPFMKLYKDMVSNDFLLKSMVPALQAKSQNESQNENNSKNANMSYLPWFIKLFLPIQELAPVPSSKLMTDSIAKDKWNSSTSPLYF